MYPRRYFSMISRNEKRMFKCVLIFIIFANFTTNSDCARILGIIPTPSYSHQIVYQPLWRELSLRGHQVTVLTTDPINDPTLTNLTEIDLNSTYELWNENLLHMIEQSQKGMLEIFNVFVTVCHDLMIEELEHPEVQNLISNETEHFDLLMIEHIYPTMFAFAERFKCPFIGMSSIELASVIYESVGSPTHPVLYPDPILPFAGELAFFERLTSTLLPIFTKFYMALYSNPLENQTAKKYFGENYPPLEDIVNNVSLLFVNTDPILYPVRPQVPVVVRIGGGIHIKLPKPLPKDLQKLLDNSKEGFIYFSLGTNVKSKNLLTETRNVILQTFAELPYTVLWKFEIEDLPGRPDNVHIAKWFPQQDVLRHHNIRLFITQGGIQSTEESISCHVPIIGIPFFGDQKSNIRRLVQKGIGLALDYENLNKEELKKTILEVINNSKYRNKVKELAELVKDEPMSGLERAVWWTEYLLRHKTVEHLKSPAVDIPFYQYFLLDVIGFCLAILTIVLYLLIMLFRLVKRLLLELVSLFVRKPKVKVQ